MGHYSMLERLIQCLQVFQIFKKITPCGTSGITIKFPKLSYRYSHDLNYSNYYTHNAYTMGGFTSKSRAEWSLADGKMVARDIMVLSSAWRNMHKILHGSNTISILSLLYLTRNLMERTHLWALFLRNHSRNDWWAHCPHLKVRIGYQKWNRLFGVLFCLLHVRFWLPSKQIIYKLNK